MRVLKNVLAVSTLAVAAAACGKDQAMPLQQMARPGEVAWVDSLIAQQQAPIAAVSPMEMGLAAAPDSAAQAVPVAAAAEPRRSSASSSSKSSSSRSTRRSRARSSGSYGGGSGTYSAPARQGRVVVKRNTHRDAAIGAAGGAVIGAVAGGRRHRVRNAVIGAVVGGAAGAVIGHTVDKQTRIEY